MGLVGFKRGAVVECEATTVYGTKPVRETYEAALKDLQVLRMTTMKKGNFQSTFFASVVSWTLGYEAPQKIYRRLHFWIDAGDK